jgi:hypothetical protein
MSSDTSASRTPNPKDPDWTCLHKGAALQSILVYPEIQSFTIFTKDAPAAPDLGRALAEATRLLIEKYPMLRGELAIVKNKTVGTQLWVLEGARAVSDDFFTEEDWTHEQSLLGMASLSVAQCLERVQTHVAPRTAKPLNTTEQEARQAPLCQVRLLALPDDVYCLLVGVSHAIADGGTYYRLVDELVAVVQDKNESVPPPPNIKKPATLDWDNPALSTHEFGGAGGLPFLVGLLWSVLINLFYPRPKAQILVFDRQKITDQKTSLKDAATPYLSSNDIVLAALQQANATRTMTSLIVNDRARCPHLGPHDAGNYLSSLLLPTTLGRNPNRIRSVVTAGTYYGNDNDAAPTSYLYRMSIMIVSSWATAQGDDCAVTPKGTRLVCHLPHPAFVESFPLDVAVVFAASPDCLAVSHNFYASYWSKESTALLDAIAVTQEA